MSAAIAVGAVVVTEVVGREDLSGLVQSLSRCSARRLLAMPAASLAMSHGRRIGLGLAYGLGAAGALIAVLGTQAAVLPAAAGGHGAAGQRNGGRSAGPLVRRRTSRLAGSRAGRSPSSSWSTTVGAVAGPNLAGPAGDLAGSLGIELLAGPFLVGAVVLGLGAGGHLRLAASRSAADGAPAR